MANKKEPMSVSLSKLVLAVSVIVFIGALFGAVGYLASHSQKSIVPVINTAVEKEITITTNKTEYEQGEIVKFTAKNNLSSEYELHWPYFEIEKKENEQWEKIIISDCDCLNVECKVDRSLKILQKKEIFAGEWNLKTVKCGKEYGSESLMSSAGLYRAKLVGRITSHTHWSLDYFYSNEFTIKEKTEIYSNYNEVPDRYDGSYSVKGFINNAENLDNKAFVLKGIVDKKFVCSGCPKGAICEPCAPPHLFITDPVIKKDSKYSVAINFGGDQKTVDSLKVGDNIVMNVSYNANGDGVIAGNVQGSVWFLSFFEKEPSVSDIKIEWVKFIEDGEGNYDLIAKLNNTNILWGASSLKYRFVVHKEDESIINTELFNGYILPNISSNGYKYIIFDNLKVDKKIKKVDIELSNLEWYEIKNDSNIPDLYNDIFEISNKSNGVSDDKNNIYSVSGLTKNISNYSFFKVDIIVLLYNKENEIIGVGETDQWTMGAGKGWEFEIFWSNQINSDIDHVEYNVQSNVSNSAEFMRDYEIIKKDKTEIIF